MTGEVELREPPPPWPCKPRVAVMLETGSVGGHTGIYFVQEDGSLALFHLAFHHELRCEHPMAGGADPAGWVAPRIPVERQNIVAALCETVAEEHRDGRIGYGFAFRGSFISASSRIVLGQGEAGLTCATLVMLVFRQAGIELLETATWGQITDPVRLAEDRAAQLALVDILKKRLARMNLKRGKTAEEISEMTLLQAHIQRMAAEVGCARFRAEEVAAASGMATPPVSFADAAREGAALLVRVKQRGG